MELFFTILFSVLGLYLVLCLITFVRTKYEEYQEEQHRERARANERAAAIQDEQARQERIARLAAEGRTPLPRPQHPVTLGQEHGVTWTTTFDTETRGLHGIFHEEHRGIAVPAGIRIREPKPLNPLEETQRQEMNRRYQRMVYGGFYGTDDY